MEQLSSLDSAFVYLESARTPMHVGGVYLIDRGKAGTGLSYARLRAHVAGRLQLARTFRQRLIEVPLTLGHPFWVEDPDFDLDLHLPRYTLPAPGGKRELMALAAELHGAPLERSRPLWELAFVDGVDEYPGMSRGSVALVGRVHHAAVDGMSGVEIMGALLDPAPDTDRNLPPDPWQPERLPGGLELAARSYRSLGAKSIALARGLRQTVRGAGEVLIATEDDAAGKPAVRPTLPLQAPRSKLNHPVSGRQTFGGVDFDLARLKDLRSRVPGATVNDVVLAVCAGALRGWLAAHDGLPRKPLVAMVPVSVRGAADQGALGNQVSAMLVDLATELEEPLLRLAAIRRATQSAKSTGMVLPANRLMDFVPSETAALAARLYTRLKVAERHRPFFNLVITNVPGPQIPIYMAGARVHGHLGMAPIFDGMGMILVVFSLSGRLSIGITACAEILEDVAEFEEMLGASLVELEAAAATPASELDELLAGRGRRPEIAALHDASQRLGAAIERLNRSLDEEE
nr:putative wax ester synthase/acyl-CoA:diacylglycerol acyltransferase [uncultured bacterium]